MIYEFWPLAKSKLTDCTFTEYFEPNCSNFYFLYLSVLDTLRMQSQNKMQTHDVIRFGKVSRNVAVAKNVCSAILMLHTCTLYWKCMRFVNYSVQDKNFNIKKILCT